MDEKTDTEPTGNHEEVVLKLHPRQLAKFRYWAAFEDMTVEDFVCLSAEVQCKRLAEHHEARRKRAEATLKPTKSGIPASADNVVELKGIKANATVQ